MGNDTTHVSLAHRNQTKKAKPNDTELNGITAEDVTSV